jgi:tetratricopeptide (TPR) repeat protein
VKKFNQKTILAKRINNDLANKNFKDLSITYPIAEEYEVSKSLLKRAASQLGNYFVEEKRFDEAIKIFNKARVLDQTNRSIFSKFIKCIDLFFIENVEEFSKKDLAEFKQAILPIINFHKVNFPEHRQIIESIDHLFRRIDYRIEYVAKDVQESKVTFRIQQIKNALYDDDMTIEQVRQEAARLLAPTLRRMYDEYEKKEAEEKEEKKKVNDKKKKVKKKKE